MAELAHDGGRVIPTSPQVSPPITSPNGTAITACSVIAERIARKTRARPSWSTACATTRYPHATAGSDAGACTSVAKPQSASISQTRSGQRLPYMFLAILVLSFVLLMLVFRSLLVPLKAVIMNLLSIGAAYGVMVAIFQWGWLKNLVGVGKEGPIEAWVPMMLFAIVFGLSMDYEVFLLSRIKEEYDRTARQRHRRRATASPSLHVSSPRLPPMMICVFGSFVLGDLRVLKHVGLGLAVRRLHRRHHRATRTRARNHGAARRSHRLGRLGNGQPSAPSHCVRKSL